jgi:hypothetical protein
MSDRSAWNRSREFTGSASDWALEMVRLREFKPRPLHKRYGKNPTPEQVAFHKEEERNWNRLYRYASKMQKKMLEEQFSTFRG